GWAAGPAFVAFSQDGRRVVVAGRRDDPVEYHDGIVAIYEANTGHPIRRVIHDEIRQAALSPDRTVLVVASSHGGLNETHLTGIEVESGRALYKTPLHRGRGGFWSIEAMNFRPGTQILDVAMGNSEVHRIDALTGKDETRFVADWRSPEQKKANRPDWAQMWEGSFSPDGRTLVSSSDEFVYVWDVESGALRRKIRHPHDHGCILTVAPDGRTVATSDLNYAGDPGEDALRLFNIETGENVLTIDPGDRRASILTFSPDGSKLLAGFYRGSTLVWDVSRVTGVTGKKP
ncbi:WD40 repeat domain-containing protein, partial [Singulisphaera rosea]